MPCYIAMLGPGSQSALSIKSNITRSLIPLIRLLIIYKDVYRFHWRTIKVEKNQTRWC